MKEMPLSRTNRNVFIISAFTLCANSLVTIVHRVALYSKVSAVSLPLSVNIRLEHGDVKCNVME